MTMNLVPPMMVLVAWTLLMLVVLVIIRLPAMKAAGIDLMTLKGGHPGALDKILAEKKQWPAHNYMHLVEQPTLFYVVCFALIVLHAGGGWNPTLAWIYVGLRMLHSIIQITSNRILYRFTVFALSTGVLAVMVVQAFRAIIGLNLI